jgi:signal transduction histidine kinase
MQDSDRRVQRQRAGEVAALTSAAINRDMKGAWLSVLSSITADSIPEGPPYDLLPVAARIFARFPYPDTLLIWRRLGDGSSESYALNRTDRPIDWDPHDLTRDPYPVVMVRAPAALQPAVGELLQRASDRRPYAVMHTVVGNQTMQVVAQLIPGDRPSTQPVAMVALVVNLTWVRRAYLDNVLHQIARIDSMEGGMDIRVIDEHGQMIGTSGFTSDQPVEHTREFPLLFFEPALARALARPTPDVPSWTIQVRPEPGAAAAAQALRLRMLLLAALAASAAGVATLLTFRAARVRDELATMKTEFVAAVTHELKTPVAQISLVGDTLAQGRYSSAETIREYAAILSQGAARLNHLIDNILIYSKLSDPDLAYAFEPVDIADVLEDAVSPFRRRAAELGITLDIRVAPEIPSVNIDRRAIARAIGNVVDNGLKYAAQGRWIGLDVSVAKPSLVIAITDRGPGIPAAELPHVFERFYRGHRALESGSGLGLVIVRRILRDHGGSASITSTSHVGTTVMLRLPLTR